MKKINKKAVYAAHGINYENGKIYAPLFGFIAPLLVDGNSKLGKGVWTFSMLPGNFWYKMEINGEYMETCGTCNCNCPGCYAQTGFYNMPSVKQSNAIKTILARVYLDFIKRAIIAQIEADNIKLLRIHASGDFFSLDYVNAWREIVKACPSCVFWTYTKNADAENAFDDLANINIVKSVIRGYGFNFGKCEYIIMLYKALKAAGKRVYICRCGIDKNQHCTNCKGCASAEYVLFVEHSTGYDATKDAHYSELVKLIEEQEENRIYIQQH